MGLRSFLFFVVTLAVIAMLFIYYIVPFRNIDISLNNAQGDSNFTSNGDNTDLSSENPNSLSSLNNSLEQFYPNMRYPSSEIRYKINESCSLKKKNDVEEAFSIIHEKTILNFYPVEFNEEISVSCGEDYVPSDNMGGFFVAGEGGATNITQTSLFNIIHSGKVLLLKNSDCPKPNVAIHELLHALGFEHSQNKNNIMYKISNCNQEIGQDTLDLINQLYSVESLPDLEISNVTGKIHSIYLDADITIRNQGLIEAGNSTLVIYADNQEIKRVTIESIQVGYGRKISYENIFLKKIDMRDINEITFAIEANYKEIDTKNNIKNLEIQI